MRNTTLLFLALSTSVCFAQGDHHGPRIGFGMATQTAGALFQNSSNLRIAPLAGYYYEATLHEQVSLLIEALYLTKGSAYRNPALFTRTQNSYHYLEVPLIAKVSTDKEPNGLFLLLGPSMGYLVSGRLKSWTNGEKIIDVKHNLKNTENRFQFSALAGIGVESNRLSFDIRAQTSLTPFDRFARIQNVVYSVTLGYRISTLKKKKDVDDLDPE